MTLIITTTILIAEITRAYRTLSSALLADVGRMLTDVAGLVIAATAASLIEKPAASEHIWEPRRAEALAAGAQATVLPGVGTFAFIEGIERLITPRPIASVGLLVFDIVGLVGNVVSIPILVSGRGVNSNMRAVLPEVVNDALGSATVIASTAIIALTGWTRAGAVTGMLTAAFIALRAITIIREAGSILMELTPKGLDLSEIHEHLSSVPHVLDVHNLHVYEIATGPPVLAARITLANECFADGYATALLHQFQDCVTGYFPVPTKYSTSQLESRTHAEHEISNCRH